MRIRSNQKLGVVGQRGQITLDSKLAGRSVRVTKIDSGRYLVEEMSLIPTHESWAHTPKNRKIIAEGIASLKNLKKKSIKSDADLDRFFKSVQQSRN